MAGRGKGCRPVAQSWERIARGEDRVAAATNEPRDALYAPDVLDRVLGAGEKVMVDRDVIPNAAIHPSARYFF